MNRARRRWSTRLAVLSCAFALGLVPAAGAATQTVTGTGDSGAGSLRGAVASLNSSTGTDEIVFAPALAGQTITLATPLVVTKASGSLTINPVAGAVAGVKVSGGGTSALLNLTGAAPVTINQLELREGVGPSGAAGAARSGTAGAGGGDGGGGAILTDPGTTLTFQNGTLSASSGGAGGAGGASPAAIGAGGGGGGGGAIVNRGRLTVLASTLSANSGGDGGDGGDGIPVSGGNNGNITGAGGAGGGAIVNVAGTNPGDGALVVRNSTLADNDGGDGGDAGASAGAASRGGGGAAGGAIVNQSGATLTLQSSTLARNVSGLGGSGGAPATSFGDNTGSGAGGGPAAGGGGGPSDVGRGPGGSGPGGTGGAGGSSGDPFVPEGLPGIGAGGGGGGSRGVFGGTGGPAGGGGGGGGFGGGTAPGGGAGWGATGYGGGGGGGFGGGGGGGTSDGDGGAGFGGAGASLDGQGAAGSRGGGGGGAYVQSPDGSQPGGAGSRGGAALVSPPGGATVESVILADSRAPDASPLTDCRGTISGLANLVQLATGCTRQAGDTRTGDPQLGAPAVNGGPTRTMALAPTSPAIDNGSNPSALTFDQRGSPFARTVGLGTDIGAYELQGVLRVVTSLSPSGDPGRFNLQIDGATKAADVGDGGTTGSLGVVTGTRTVGETAGTSTSLGDYTSEIVCKDNDGSGSTVASGSGAGPLSVPIAIDAQIACTITNTRKAVPPPTPTPTPTPDPTPTPPPSPPFTALDLTGLFIAPKVVSATQPGTVQFRLTKDALVTLVAERLLEGRVRSGRCSVAAAAKRKPGARCLRWDFAGRRTVAGASGVNGVAFDGTLSGRALGAGRYRLTAIAVNGPELTPPRTVRVRIT